MCSRSSALGLMPQTQPRLDVALHHMLQHYPRTRALAYFGGAVLINSMCGVATRSHAALPFPMQAGMTHMLALPAGTAFTLIFTRLCAEDQDRWAMLFTRREARRGWYGAAAALGATAITNGLPLLLGWTRLTPGWQDVSSSQLIGSLLIITVMNTAIVWNEELVFRGYGFDTLTAALGQPAAIGLSATLFALTHTGPPISLAEYTLFGLTLTALRGASDSLWVPLAYHFVWNELQLLLFTRPGAMAALLQAHEQGPIFWQGRNVDNVPGMLYAIADLVVIAGAGLLWWHRRWRAQRNR